MTPFEPLTVRREMEIFGEDLGIPLNEPTLPDVEFLACLATGYPRDSALQRNELGCRFRNFYNFIRVTVRSSPTTLRRLTEYLGISETELRELARGQADGPLLTQLLDAFDFFEGVALRFVENRPKPLAAFGGGYPKSLSDALWLGKAPVRLGHAERRFVERLVSLARGLLLVQSCIVNQGNDSTPFQAAVDLCQSGRHPFGHWLTLAQRHFCCDDLSQLAKTLCSTSGDDHSLLLKNLEQCSSGTGLVEPSIVDRITQRAPELHYLLIVARILAFAIDFVCSAADQDIGRERAQALILCRLEELKVHCAVEAICANREAANERYRL